MKFLLGCYEGFVGLVVKRDVSEDGRGYEGSDLLDLSGEGYTEGSTSMEVVGGQRVTTGAFICSRYILKALTRVA